MTDTNAVLLFTTAPALTVIAIALWLQNFDVIDPGTSTAICESAAGAWLLTLAAIAVIRLKAAAHHRGRHHMSGRHRKPSKPLTGDIS